jgi:hypothetical protein
MVNSPAAGRGGACDGKLRKFKHECSRGQTAASDKEGLASL